MVYFSQSNTERLNTTQTVDNLNILSLKKKRRYALKINQGTHKGSQYSILIESNKNRLRKYWFIQPVEHRTTQLNSNIMVT